MGRVLGPHCVVISAYIACITEKKYVIAIVIVYRTTESRCLTRTIYIYTRTIYIYIYIYVCVCVVEMEKKIQYGSMLISITHTLQRFRVSKFVLCL